MPTEPQLLDEQALAEIEARAEAATEGPWEIQPSTLPPYSVGVICQYESHDCLFVPDSAGAMIDSVEMIANLTFASHARTDVPALCQTVRAAWARLAETHERNQKLFQQIEAEHKEEVTALREQLAQQLDTLTSCDSVLSYIYHRERSRLLPATQEQVLDTMREIEKITRRKP